MCVKTNVRLIKIILTGVTMDGSTKITAMNVDCFERILDHLDFADLLNVACSNVHLRHGANVVFVQRYGRRKIRFADIRVSSDRLFTFEADAIEVRDLRTSLQFIRGFGCSIAEIEIVHKERFFHHYQCIVDHINEFCADIITEIEIKELNKFNRFNKPFNNVQRMTIKGCCPFDSDCFVRLFPNVRELKIHSHGRSLLRKDGFTARHFPLLRHLDMTLCLLHEYNPLSEYIVDSLRLNPQLTFLRLKIYGKILAIDVNSLQSVSESLQQLENLELIVNQNFFNNSNGKMIHLKNVKNLYIEWLTQVELPNFYLNSFSFDRLETLYLHGWCTDLDCKFFEFMEKNSSVKRITIKPRVFDISTFLEHYKAFKEGLKREKLLSTIDEDHTARIERRTQHQSF